MKRVRVMMIVMQYAFRQIDSSDDLSEVMIVGTNFRGKKKKKRVAEVSFIDLLSYVGDYSFSTVFATYMKH